jgi:hypothetical protein
MARRNRIRPTVDWTQFSLLPRLLAVADCADREWKPCGLERLRVLRIWQIFFVAPDPDIPILK